MIAQQVVLALLGAWVLLETRNTDWSATDTTTKGNANASAASDSVPESEFVVPANYGTKGNNSNVLERSKRDISVVYPKKGLYYKFANCQSNAESCTNKVCLSLDEYRSGRTSTGTTIGTYTRCHYADTAYQFQVIPMRQTNGDSSPGFGDWIWSDCVQIVNRYSGGCLTVPNNYQEGSGSGGEIEGVPVSISGCGPIYVGYGKATYQAWRIKGTSTMALWIETCSLPQTKYLGRGVDGTQQPANLFLDTWKGYSTQGWVVLGPSEKDVDENQPVQYGCGSTGNCWAGGDRSRCGLHGWCYTTGGTMHKCANKFECIAHMSNLCYYGPTKCATF